MVSVIFHRNVRVVVAIVFFILPFVVLLVLIDFINIQPSLPKLTLLHGFICPDNVICNESTSNRISKSEIILHDRIPLSSPLLDANTPWIRKRLLEADANWKRSHQKRREVMLRGLFIKKLMNSESQDFKLKKRVIWDYFYPSFDCPFTVERIGTVGNGGKWVCGFGELQKKTICLVYTFGVGQEFSFEEEVLLRTSCIIRIFNSTLTEPPSIVKKYPDRAFFYGSGIHYQNEGNGKTLATLMDINRDTFIDILKVDIEGSEFGVLKSVVRDFPDVLPFGQLQIEIHLHRLPSSLHFLLLAKFWVLLEDAGLRSFHHEPNLHADPLKCNEFTFLNINVNPFRFE